MRTQHPLASTLAPRGVPGHRYYLGPGTGAADPGAGGPDACRYFRKRRGGTAGRTRDPAVSRPGAGRGFTPRSDHHPRGGGTVRESRRAADAGPFAAIARFDTEADPSKRLADGEHGERTGQDGKRMIEM